MNLSLSNFATSCIVVSKSYIAFDHLGSHSAESERIVQTHRTCLVRADVGMWRWIQVITQPKQCVETIRHSPHCFLLWKKQPRSDAGKGVYMMQTNTRLVFLVEAAILGAIAFLLDLLTSYIGKMPQGGSISLAMVPVLIMGFRHGIKGGLLTGFLLGLLQTIMGYTTIVHPVQGFLDYFVAFTVVGTGGIFYKQVQNAINPLNKGRLIVYVAAAAFLGSLLRFAVHTIAGAVFFAEFAGDKPVLIYSAAYNASYMVPTFIICSIILVLMLTASKSLILKRK